MNNEQLKIRSEFKTEIESIYFRNNYKSQIGLEKTDDGFEYSYRNDVTNYLINQLSDFCNEINFAIEVEIETGDNAIPEAILKINGIAFNILKCYNLFGIYPNIS